MTLFILFTLLLTLAWERLFKRSDRWQLDHRLEWIFSHIHRFSLSYTLAMVLLWMVIVACLQYWLDGVLFDLFTLLFWLAVLTLCFGAGKIRRYYHEYLVAARQKDDAALMHRAKDLMLISQGYLTDALAMPAEENKSVDKVSVNQPTLTPLVPASHIVDNVDLTRLQRALLWHNYRFYIAPLFYLVIGGNYGIVLLAGYAFARAWQTWLALHHDPQARQQSGIDCVLHYLDWIPARIAALLYAFLAHGEQALSRWFASLTNNQLGAYQLISELASITLAHKQPTVDDVDALVNEPQNAVSLARKVMIALVVLVSLLMIYAWL